MPTADEVVRSLVRDDANAGCAWGGALAESADCDVRPDKESPLWATDRSPVYYWTADEANEQNCVFVCYNGMVNADRKYSGNPRHSHRCVREP